MRQAPRYIARSTYELHFLRFAYQERIFRLMRCRHRRRSEPGHCQILTLDAIAYVGVSDVSDLSTLACARMSMKPKHCGRRGMGEALGR
jgi:hypothetical protein